MIICNIIHKGNKVH